MRNVTLAFALVLALFPGSAGAQPVSHDLVVTLSEPGGLEPITIARAVDLAAQEGANATVLGRGTLQLLSVTRAGEVIQEPLPGYRYPMDTLTVDAGDARPLMGPSIADVLADGGLVMGHSSANLRNAQVDDEIMFIGWDGQIHVAVIGLIAPDEDVYYAELIFSQETASSFDFERPSVIKFWETADDFPGKLRQHFDQELIGVSSTLDPPNPSGVLPAVAIKVRFGEFAYRPTSGDAIMIEEAWVTANIVTVNLPLLGPFKCHRLLVPYLEAAIDDVIRAGYAQQIDSADFQLAGGCFNARLIRGGDKGGAISRHAYGAAVDINPSTNPYGGVITMDERVGDIFHNWGFAWGGGWLFTDGAHFEWRHLPHQVARA